MQEVITQFFQRFRNDVTESIYAAKGIDDYQRLKAYYDYLDIDRSAIFRKKQEVFPCGLRNIGNTCYLNVFLQVLYHINFLREKIFANDNSKSKILQQLKILFARMQLGKLSFVDTTDLFEELKKKNPDVFIEGTQNDFHQICTIILDELKECFKSSESDQKVIEKTFFGKLSVKTYHSEGKSHRNTRFNLINLNVAHESLQNALEYWKKYHIEDYLTENKKIVKAQVQNQFIQTPALLTFFINRVGFKDGKLHKDCRQFKFENIIQLQKSSSISKSVLKPTGKSFSHKQQQLLEQKQKLISWINAITKKKQTLKEALKYVQEKQFTNINVPLIQNKFDDISPQVKEFLQEEIRLIDIKIDETQKQIVLLEEKINRLCDQGEVEVYQLWGMMIHLGTDPASGHYKVVLQTDADTWMEFNDRKVLKIYLLKNYRLQINGLTQSLKMIKQVIQYQNKPGLRQDILSFTQDDPRRKRFFICLKMLGILPCHENNKGLQFNINVRTKGGNSQQIDSDSMLYTKPQRIHDELIASHVTCCEHNTPFFGYYHRNLLIYAQMQLNYADQYLRFQLAQDHSQHQQIWRQLMTEYRKIIEDMKNKDIFQEKLMMHYWNPTNYTINKETQKSAHFPIQLLPKRKLQTVDILFQAVNSHLPWNFNFRTRFFSHLSEEQYQSMDITTQINDFFSFEKYLRYTQEQKMILLGEANPRSSNPQMVRHFFDNYTRRVNGRSSLPINAIIANEVGIRNKQYYEREGQSQVIPLYNMTQNQFALNYGTGTHNMHWLNPTQIKQVNSQIKTPKMIPQYYNTLLPHYQFAYAYVKSQKSLISNYLGGAASASSPTDYQRRLQNSHNTMHNNLAFIMSDPNFSLTNLIFFPFHSWIDYQLQVKIRQLTNDPVAYNIAQKQLGFKRQRTIYDIVSKEKGPFTIGSYRLVDWVDPRVGAWRWNSSQSQQAAKYYFQKSKLDPLKSFRYSFNNTTFAEFVLNSAQKHIRRSDELNQIYKSQYQTNQQINQRFSYMMNLKEYDFNYNYEIYDQGKRIIMNKNVPILPIYITKIVEVIGGSRQPKVNFSTGKTASVNNNQNVQLQSSQQGAFFNTFTPLKVKQRLLENPILALGKYSSQIKTNIYHIEIKFLINNFQPYTKLLSQSDIAYIKSGFLIKSFSIFSKSQSSVTCPKCLPTKKFWVDVGDKLRQTFPNIWKVVNLFILQQNRILYSSSKSQKVNEQNVLYTSEIIKLVTDPQKLRPFMILEGAEQVQFDVILVNNSLQQEVSVKLELQVYSMFNQKIQSIMTKTLYSLQQQTSMKHFDFYKVMDVASSSAQNNFDQFDKYYYKKVKCQIVIGEEIKIISFSIPNYHRLARYIIKLQYLGQNQNKQDKIFVEIQDRDYEFKKDYYLQWQDDLYQ